MASGSYSNPLLRVVIVLQRLVYRLSGGRIMGRTLGVETLLLTSVGARSGRPRTTPLVYLPDGDGWALFATDNGADRNPAWYHNLRAHPEASVQIGREHFRVRATLAPEEERRRLWEDAKQVVGRFPMYERRTKRAAIPVFQLRRLDA